MAINIEYRIKCDKCGHTVILELNNPNDRLSEESALDYAGMRRVGDGRVLCEACYTKWATAQILQNQKNKAAKESRK